MIVTAKLTKRQTSDGLLEMGDQISLGREYRVDLSTIQIRGGYNFIHRVEWEREMVQDIEGGWLPTEMLEWD
jgi:hypothetical protein